MLRRQDELVARLRINPETERAHAPRVKRMMIAEKIAEFHPESDEARINPEDDTRIDPGLNKVRIDPGRRK